MSLARFSRLARDIKAELRTQHECNWNEEQPRKLLRYCRSAINQGDTAYMSLSRWSIKGTPAAIYRARLWPAAACHSSTAKTTAITINLRRSDSWRCNRVTCRKRRRIGPPIAPSSPAFEWMTGLCWCQHDAHIQILAIYLPIHILIHDTRCYIFKLNYMHIYISTYRSGNHICNIHTFKVINIFSTISTSTQESVFTINCIPPYFILSLIQIVTTYGYEFTNLPFTQCNAGLINMSINDRFQN